MVINGIKDEATIMRELDEDRHNRDKAFVEKELAKARRNLEKAEINWEQSGGYGSRAPINRWSDQERLCLLALKAVEQSCGKCSRRNKTCYELIKKLDARRKAGVVMLHIEDVRSMIDMLWG